LNAEGGTIDLLVGVGVGGCEAGIDGELRSGMRPGEPGGEAVVDIEASALVPCGEERPCCEAWLLERFLSTSGLSARTDGPKARFGVELAASKSGGGSSCRDVEAANAIASAPYGMPKRANDSRDEMIASCSGVGPDFGYVNSVRTSVCGSGAEIACSESEDVEVSPAGGERGRPSVRKAEEVMCMNDAVVDVEVDGRCETRLDEPSRPCPCEVVE
jgi:hypothetical protein